MEQVRLCAVWPTENWIGSSMNHIQGCMTVWESCRCRHALDKGYLMLMHCNWTKFPLVAVHSSTASGKSVHHNYLQKNIWWSANTCEIISFCLPRLFDAFLNFWLHLPKLVFTCGEARMSSFSGHFLIWRPQNLHDEMIWWYWILWWHKIAL